MSPAHLPKRATLTLRVAALTLALFAATAQADPGARLIATGGATTVEGAAGGGLVPWALLSGYGEQGQAGGSAWATRARAKDFTLQAFGAATSFGNRLELSVARQRFDINSVAAGQTLQQTIVGAKLRVYGELVYSHGPQWSLGAQYKRNDEFAIPSAVGARDDAGFDLYLAASKLWLDGPWHRSLFVNATLRATRANQTGLLGFGGDRKNTHTAQLEASAGLFLNRHWVLGAEFRQKPDNLGFAREDHWRDLFVGWFPDKRVSVVAAWSVLGSIAGFDDQEGLYLSLQISQ